MVDGLCRATGKRPMWGHALSYCHPSSVILLAVGYEFKKILGNDNREYLLSNSGVKKDQKAFDTLPSSLYRRFSRSQSVKTLLQTHVAYTKTAFEITDDK
jgi:hypothetical protein